MQRAEVNALLDTDLPEFLQRNGLLTDFEAGRITCFNCGRVIDTGNIHTVFKSAGRIQFCCNLSVCINCSPKGTSK